jgi:hypothetical protein
MHIRMSRILAGGLAALFLARPVSHAQTPSSATILFEILGEEKGKIPAAATIEPLVLIENGHLKKPVEYDPSKQEESNAVYDRFAKEYFARGRKYPLLIGGAEKGLVTVGEPVGEGCISLAATVTSTVPLSNAQFALAATTTKGLGIHADWRRPVSAQERAEFLVLVKKALGQKKVENISESSIKVENLRSTKLNASGPDVIIGSATLESKTGIHQVFLVAARKGVAYEEVLSSYHLARDEDDASASVENLVEQVDLDGDGTDEIVTINTYYEGWDYTVYKEQKGRWKKVYQGGGGGC